MTYNAAHFWTGPDGLIWHSYSNTVHTRDLTMGPVDARGGVFQQRQYEKSLAWARSHGMSIKDEVCA